MISLKKQISLERDINSLKVNEDLNLGEISSFQERVENDDFFLISVSKVKHNLKLRGKKIEQQGAAKATSLILSELQQKLSKVRVWKELQPILEKGVYLAA